MTRDEASAESARQDDITTVMFFLLHLMNENPQAMWGGHKVTEAFDAASRMAFPGHDPRAIQKMMEEIG